MNQLVDLSILLCPICKNGNLGSENENQKLICSNCSTTFPVVDGRPILMRVDNDVFSTEGYMKMGDNRADEQGKKWLKRFSPSASVNLSRDRVLSEMKQRLSQVENPIVLVIGGGQQRTQLNSRLTSGKPITILYSDIDIYADVDLFCDAHDLPIADRSIDAIITTAVLEHVLYPERAASEIQRVLKPGALLYSELPFIQQVHEGAYDFTRYTLSGHRRLFNGVGMIDSGMVAGPGTALVWTIENFFMAFTKGNFSRKIAKLSGRVLFGWVKYFDYILRNNQAAMDAASCTFVFGERLRGSVPDAEIISGYVGAQNLSHT